jgi:WD40 repeat protein
VASFAREPNDQDDNPYAPRRTLAFSPDGRLLAVTGRDGAVRLWDVAARRELRRLDGGQGRVGRVAFAPDGRSLAVGGADGTVLVWDVADLMKK